jgi:hypothetical protein
MSASIEEYTPTTSDILRYFVAPAYKVDPQQVGEEFSAYLSRISIETMHSRDASERAARRWIVLYRATVLKDAVEWARSLSGESADAAADYIEDMISPPSP